MTELAAINAKIDRLNAKLKADPIVVVHESRVLPDIHFFSIRGNTATAVCDSFRSTSQLMRYAKYLLAQREALEPELALLARKIQLAILERLTG